MTEDSDLRSMANGYKIAKALDTMTMHDAPKLAAAFDRGHPGIRKITERVDDGACVWVDKDHDEDRGVPITAPDGWEHDGAFVSDTGGVAIRFRRPEDE